MEGSLEKKLRDCAAGKKGWLEVAIQKNFRTGNLEKQSICNDELSSQEQVLFENKYRRHFTLDKKGDNFVYSFRSQIIVVESLKDQSRFILNQLKENGS